MARTQTADNGEGWVVCPHCRKSFRLDESHMDQLRRDLEAEQGARLRRELRKELLAETEKKAQKLAQDLAAKELAKKDEELRLKDKQIQKMNREMVKISTKATVDGAQQLGGIREETLAEGLRRRFPDDDVQGSRPGQRGGDVVEIVRNAGGKEFGSILWESKRTAAFSKSWLPKLKGDQKRGHHTLAVLVSEARPDNKDVLCNMDGVWITSPEAALAVAEVLRDQIILVATAQGTRARRDDLKGRIYDYVAGPDLACHFKGIIEAAVRLQQSLDKERNALEAQWRDREQQIRAIGTAVAELCGDLRGIGAPSPELQELPGAGLLQLPAPALER